MQIVNYKFRDIDSLSNFIYENNIINSNQVLIQVFHSGIENISLITQVKNALVKELSKAVIIGTTTSGVVSHGKVLDDCINICFSIFENSHVNTLSFLNTSQDEIMQKVNENLLNEDTKLLIIFANIYTFNANELIKNINQLNSNVIVCGGYAGDDFLFEKEKHLIVSNDCDFADVIITSVDSKVLKVATNYFLNWQTIGKDMKITKCEDNVIHEINNKKAIDIYRHYLGKDLVSRLPSSGIEFPLIFIENEIQVSRVPLSVRDDGSIEMSGCVYKNSNVKFSFSNVEYLDKKNIRSINENTNIKAQAVYVYSCAGRRKNIGRIFGR